MNPLSKISGEGQVAAIYGLEEAVFLDSIMFWYRTNRADNRNFHEGRWWTYNSIKAYGTGKICPRCLKARTAVPNSDTGKENDNG